MNKLSSSIQSRQKVWIAVTLSTFKINLLHHSADKRRQTELKPIVYIYFSLRTVVVRVGLKINLLQVNLMIYKNVRS
jgi:hypothetical protein